MIMKQIIMVACKEVYDKWYRPYKNKEYINRIDFSKEVAKRLGVTIDLNWYHSFKQDIISEWVERQGYTKEGLDGWRLDNRSKNND